MLIYQIFSNSISRSLQFTSIYKLIFYVFIFMLRYWSLRLLWDQVNKTALHKAAEKGYKEIVVMLLDVGCDLEASDMVIFYFHFIPKSSLEVPNVS